MIGVLSNSKCFKDFIKSESDVISDVISEKEKKIILEIARQCGLFKGKDGRIYNSNVNTYDGQGVPGVVFLSEEEMFEIIGNILKGDV